MHTAIAFTAQSLVPTAGNATSLVLDISVYPPGTYNLTVRVQDEDGQTDTATVPSLVLSGTCTGAEQRKRF